MFTTDYITHITQEQFKKLSPENRKWILKILSEYKESNRSETLDDIWKADYEEIPVSIDRFIEDPMYLGASTRNGESIYPYWRTKYREIFDPSLNYEEVVLTGAIGVGKTKTAVVCLAYLLYRLMCLRNPQKYFKFNEGDKITIFFLNISLNLAEGVGFNTLHDYLINSPWFMARGTVTGRIKKRYNPPKNITITFGSKAEHALGQQIYCLHGDTSILTTDGEFRIEDMCGKTFRTYSVDSDGNTVISNPTTVAMTTMETDYYELELDDGSIIKCTPEHKFMLSDGTYKMAKELSEDDDLMEMKPYGYVYLTTNTVNGMKYIGQHGGTFDPKYKGSGRKLKRAFNEFGKDKFVSELICYCYSFDELNEMENYYIRKHNAVEDSSYYNTTYSGVNIDMRGKEWSDLMSRRDLKKSDETCRKISDAKNRINELKGTMFWINNGIEEHLVNETEWNLMYPEFSVGRLSDAIYLCSGDKTIRVHLPDVDSYLADGYELGKSKDIGRNISKAKQKENWIVWGHSFESAKKLADYLNENGYPKIVKSTVVNLANGVRVKSYPELCGEIYRIPLEKNNEN